MVVSKSGPLLTSRSKGGSHRVAAERDSVGGGHELFATLRHLIGKERDVDVGMSDEERAHKSFKGFLERIIIACFKLRDLRRETHFVLIGDFQFVLSNRLSLPSAPKS